MTGLAARSSRPVRSGAGKNLALAKRSKYSARSFYLPRRNSGERAPNLSKTLAAKKEPAQIADERQSQLKLLIARGKEQGFLTYVEVNDHLPSEIVDP